LPIKIDWIQNGWQDLALQKNSGDLGPLTREPWGPRSFWIQIDNNNDQLFEPQKVPGGIYNAGTKIFSKLLTTEWFNSVTEGKPCFINSSSDVTWRVKTCCNKDGTDCGPYIGCKNGACSPSISSEFTTSPAPECIGITDRYNTTPVPDPDWNGPKATGDAGTSSPKIDFCTATLHWCAAKVTDSDKAYNQGQAFALSYQIQNHSNEAQVMSLATSYVPPKFTKYADWLKIDKLGFGPQETCHYLEKLSDGVCKPEVVDPTLGKEPRLYFSNDLNPNNDRDLYTKNLLYYWQPRTCFNNSNADDDSCQKSTFVNYGQKWKFDTNSAPIASPPLSFPPDDSQSESQLAAIPVGLPATIAWKQPCGANSYEYQIQELKKSSYANLLGGAQRTTSSQVMFSKTGTATANIDVEKIDLKLDTTYRWHVRSCWPSLPLHPNDCDEAWSAWFGFRATGRPPKADSMQPVDSSPNVPLPVTLQWEQVPGAQSYLLAINDKTIVVKPAGPDPVTYQLVYPDINQDQIYLWKVQTCADAGATNCGQASDTMSFGTAALGTSTGAQLPKDQETLHSQDLGLTNTFSWDQVPGAQYYRFSLTYADKSSLEKNPDCAAGKKVNTLVSQNSINIDTSPQGLYCLGNYTWNVQACMDRGCKDAGPISPDWKLTLVSGESAKKGSGFMVCGQADDNPNTPYDERETCSAKHLFLVLERIINFVLFNLAFWLLPVLGVITAVIFYKSLGGPEVWETIRSWWRAIGIGYALLFFAWIIVGVMLRIFGYTSVWWKI